MTPNSRATLARIFDDEAVKEAIDELKADLTKKVISSQSGDEARKKNLDMLWGLEALIVKIRANVEQNTGDQAE
jgi:hypothetical protein